MVYPLHSRGARIDGATGFAILLIAVTLILDATTAREVVELTESDPAGAPRNQLYSVELDLLGRYTDALPAANVPAYFMADSHAAWHYRPDA
jgi:hypothetical protein